VILTKRIKAGENENCFAKIMQEKAPEIHLLGKRYFSSGKVKISVDQSLEYGGISYLIEIDSQNIAKLLVGQYVLLNELYKQDKGKVFFLVVHAYKNYNPRRTVNNLQFINEKVYSGDGIKFGAMHITQLSQWNVKISNFKTLITLPTSEENTP
jgi:hypothetical protein